MSITSGSQCIHPKWGLGKIEPDNLITSMANVIAVEYSRTVKDVSSPFPQECWSLLTRENLGGRNSTKNLNMQ